MARCLHSIPVDPVKVAFSSRPFGFENVYSTSILYWVTVAWTVVTQLPQTRDFSLYPNASRHRFQPSTCPFHQCRLQLARGDQSAAPPGTPSPARAAAASPVAPIPAGRGPGAGSQRDSSCNRSAARTAREPRLRRPLATRPNTAPQPDTAQHGAMGEQASPRAESRPCARGARGRTPHSSRRACARPGNR